MTIHRLTARQFIARPRSEVFAFFSRPDNLARLSSPSVGLEILDRSGPMAAAMTLDYRIRPLLRIPVMWRSRIVAYDPPNAFRDVAERGPYRRWDHHHAFRDAEGGTIVEDEVEYELPLGPIGDVVHALLVRRELRRIFEFRARVLEAALRPPDAPSTGRTVAVAGGTGFVGGGIAAELHRRGEHVVVLSRGGEAARGELPDDVELRAADVTDPASLGTTLAGVDALVIALAFRNSPMESPRRGQTFMTVDGAGTENLVEAARAAGVRRIVYLSGAGAAPDARRHWFRAKWRAEEAVRGSGLTWTIIRPTWIYGPRDVSLNRFLGFARWLPFVPLTSTGRQLLAPVFIEDAARLAADALTDDAAANQVLELGGPETLSMRDIVKHATRIAGIRRPILPAPAVLLKIAAWPLSFLPEPPLTPAAVDFVNQPAVVDTRPLLERMPRRLTPLDEGLATYLGARAAGSMRLEIDGRS